jgi:hypothetical protein
MDTQDNNALIALLKSENQRMSQKHLLLRKMEAELQKDTESLDSDRIDSLINTLYAIDNETPPRISSDEIENVLLKIKKHAKPKIRIRTFPQKRTRLIRWASALFAVLAVFFLVNYSIARISGTCLLRKVDVNFCCHTIYCPDTDEFDHSGHS